MKFQKDRFFQILLITFVVTFISACFENEAGVEPVPAEIIKATNGIKYSTSTFRESNKNNGIISNSIVLTLTTASGTGIFNGTDGKAVDYISFDSIPDGLTAEFIKKSNTEITITMSGHALAHASSDNATQTLTVDISGLTIDYGVKMKNLSKLIRFNFIDVSPPSYKGGCSDCTTEINCL